VWSSVYHGGSQRSFIKSGTGLRPAGATTVFERCIRGLQIGVVAVLLYSCPCSAVALLLLQRFLQQDSMRVVGVHSMAPEVAISASRNYLGTPLMQSSEEEKVFKKNCNPQRLQINEKAAVSSLFLLQ
jgi:hypothetical protein